MTQPFNYMMNVQDPVQALQNGMAFGQQQRAGEQAMVMNDQTMGLRDAQEQRAQTAFGQQNTLFDQQQQDRAAGLEKAKAQQADLLGLAEKIASGEYSAADFAEIAAKHPDLVGEMGKMWEGTSAERKQADVAQLFKGVTAIKAGRPDLAVQMLEERAVAAENAGDKMEADIARATAAAIEADPAAGMASLGLLLQSVDPKAATAVFGEGKRVQSTNAYANGTTVTVFTDGSKQVSDAAGNVIGGVDAQAAVDAAIASEAQMRGGNAAATEAAKLDTRIDKGGTAAATEEAGKQAIAMSGKAFEDLNKVRTGITNIDTAIDALDRGGRAGAVDKYLPSITDASASLENAMNRMGLDVIGSVTFGALSEGEMRLAMETAVPRNLGQTELKQWLQRKRDAQEKAADALRAAAIYLGTPGNTLAGWLESQGPAFDPAEIEELIRGP
jgi:hypothetical protein